MILLLSKAGVAKPRNLRSCSNDGSRLTFFIQQTDFESSLVKYLSAMVAILVFLCSECVE